MMQHCFPEREDSSVLERLRHSTLCSPILKTGVRSHLKILHAHIHNLSI